MSEYLEDSDEFVDEAQPKSTADEDTRVYRSRRRSPRRSSDTKGIVSRLDVKWYDTYHFI
jgi:hypothetical protein